MRDLYFEHELEDQTEESLNDCHEIVTICGYDYDQGTALKRLDPIAFRQEVLNYMDWFEELTVKDLTEKEKEHYVLSESQVVYCRGEGL